MSLHRLFAPLNLLEQLHARISAQLESFDNILSDTPSEREQVRQTLVTTTRILRQSLHTLETERLACYLRVHRGPAVSLRLDVAVTFRRSQILTNRLIPSHDGHLFS